MTTNSTTERRTALGGRYDYWHSGIYTINNTAQDRERFTITNVKTGLHHTLNANISFVKKMYPCNQQNTTL